MMASAIERDIVAAIERDRRDNNGPTVELLKVPPRQVAEAAASE